jgi:hypothetical protein
MKFCNRILVVPDVPGMLLNLILKLPIEGWAVSQSRIWFRDRQDMWVHMLSSSIRFGRDMLVCQLGSSYDYNATFFSFCFPICWTFFLSPCISPCVAAVTED